MAHSISDECIACGTCAGVCPSEAISEGNGKFVIDPEICIDCGSCVDECPVGAISAQ
jgi:NAD-dependent dihydropyrimidine dehydrogenase PreA subunit